MILVYWFVLVNVLAFILYGMDKSFARRHMIRIPEKALLFWAIIGGAIGAFLGMHIFHHKTQKPKFKVVPVFVLINVIFIAFCLYQNYHLTVTEMEADIGLEDEITIVQISDLHNQFFGPKQKRLLDEIKGQEPDIIVVTGDIVDHSHTNYKIARDFIEGAVKIAPVYYVTGNHEVWLSGDKMDGFISWMKQQGVIILDDRYIDMGEYILAGIADSSLDSFNAYGSFDDTKPVILLSHEPQYNSLYLELGADLVFTGHYHGGQIIIPGLGGVISPEFELFPDLFEGMHDIEGMKLVVSRGLGNSILPVRINNYPEIITLHVS